MRLISARQLSKQPNMPGYTTLVKVSNRKKRPSFVHWKDKILSIDEDSPDWLIYLAKWRDKKRKSGKPEQSPYDPKGNTQEKSVLHSSDGPPEGSRAWFEIEKLKASVREINLSSEIKEAKLKKEQGILIARDLAEFLYFGYMDKMSTDLLKIPKKITPRIRNLVVENDPDEIVKTILRELTVVIQHVKKDQKDRLDNWLAENDS